MIKDLRQIIHQRNGFVRVRLLIDYLKQLEALEALEEGHYETSDGAMAKYVVVARGWKHDGEYVQLVYVPRLYRTRYLFLMGAIEDEIETYEAYDCSLDDVIPLTETLIEYIVAKSREV